jgi:uncharacterized protein (TIGR02145 family)
MGWGLNQYRLVKIEVRRPCKGYYLRWYYNGWHYWFFLPGKSLVLTEGERYRTLGTKKVSMGSGQITSFQIDAIRTILNSKEVAMYTNAGWMAIRIEQTPAIVRTNQIAGYEMDFTAIIGSKEISYITGFSPILNIPTVIPPVIGQCEITIGTQVWMCKNFEGEYPGSKVYNNNELSRTVYGGLYTLSQINNPGFCPSGWHVPTLADWNELINFLGGAAVAGARLKETGLAYWEYEAADNSSGFAARGSGMYWMGVFSNLSIYGNLWYDGGIISIQASLISVQIIPITTLIDYFIGVRLIKDTPAPALPTIFDKDGNEYHQIIIGTQIWIVENLRTTKYADDSAIPNLILDVDWLAEDGTPGHNGGYCWYNNDIANKVPYGALYNWYAINNVHGLAYFERLGIQELGWREPLKTDFDILKVFLGGDTVAGGKLKEIGLTHWLTPNTGATDEYGFKAIGSGKREDDGTFDSITGLGWLWSNTEAIPATHGELLNIQASVESIIVPSIYRKKTGIAIRCIKDVI